MWGSTSRGCSHIELPAEKVRELAETCLAFVQRQRAREKRDAISRERDRIEKSWTQRFGRRWLGWDFPLDEEIEKRVEAFWSSNHFPAPWESNGWGSKEVAEKLLKAAKHADKVTVSLSDLDMIT